MLLVVVYSAAASFKRDSRLLIIFHLSLFLQKVFPPCVYVFGVFVWANVSAVWWIYWTNPKEMGMLSTSRPSNTCCCCLLLHLTIVRVAFTPFSPSSSTRFTTQNVCINMWMMEEKSWIYISRSVAVDTFFFSISLSLLWTRGRNKLVVLTEFKVCWVSYI
jgi:hypothetical protein